MTIRVAICGAGYIADIHARAVKAQKDLELVAIVEKFPEKAASFARKFAVKHCYTELTELLKEGGVEAVIIGTPNFMHAPQALAALEAGLHVMVEKPMAMSASEAEQILAASQKSGTTLMVAHCWRFDADVLWLNARLDKIGRIIRTKGYGVHVRWGPSGWFTQKQLAGGGALADMGIHALDTARFLLGDPQPVSVYAKIGTYYGDYDVDDTDLLLVNWEGGAVSYIESGWWQPYADGPEAATQLYGMTGFASLFPTHLLLPGKKEREMVKTACPNPFPRGEHCAQEMYNAQMAYFADCIRSGRVPVPGGAEGLINMRLVDAAYASARTGKVVTL